MARRYRYQNTRQWVRLPCGWYVKYTVEGSREPEALARMGDLSAGGVRMFASKEISVGTRLRMKVHVPPLERSIAADGRVVRCQPANDIFFEVGVQFEEIAEEDRNDLNQQIEMIEGPRGLARHRRSWWRTA